MLDHPLLAPWTGAHGGFPRFDQITTAGFPPALHAAMDAQRAELAAITGSHEAPTFANTVLAFENSGRPYARATSLFGTYRSTMSDKPMQQLAEDLAPILSAFGDEITQNAQLFARIEAVYNDRAHLAAGEQRLVEVVYRTFARQGAALAAPAKQRLAAINARLASLYTKFSQHELAEEEEHWLALGDADLAGLPETLCASAKQAAEAKGQPGWLIANTRSAMEPFLVYSARRDLRERGWRMWTSRCDNHDAHDNKALIAEILALRAERAKLLGFATHAHWIIDDGMARTPDAAKALMMKVWRAAVARVREELADMQALAPEAISPWDYRYYAEQVRKARYDLDQNEVKPYLQLANMRDAMFWTAEQLYGLVFTLVADVPVYHPDVTVYEVTRDGVHVGLWYFDPYARDGKQSGAWMSEYRTQERGVAPVVSNNANFVKGKPGEPVLISWEDAVTMFHEFGHALHGLCSNATYPTLAGTNVKRDFVEFPSQLNEHWLATPEVLNRFALHYQTGKPIPPALVAKIGKARNFNKGFGTVEYLAAAIYDLEIHLATPPIDPAEFERRTMAAIGCPAEIVMRHRPPHFAHIFSGDGYSAGYYAYIWADTLTADAAEAFAEAGFYDPATAKRLFDAILSAGNSIAPEAAFRSFRGRDVDSDALMRDRGFPLT